MNKISIPMQARSLWHLSPTQSTIETSKLPPLTSNQLLIKSHFSLISTGTERLIATGKVPVSLHKSMRVQGMDGSFTFPIKYGYSLVGEVLSEGNWKGKFVHLMHPHQDYVIVNKSWIDLIPEGISPRVASLASNMETAINAVWDSGVSLGDKVLVCGFGMIGGLVARLLSMMPAVEVYIAEKDKERLALAKSMGFNLVSENHDNFDYSIHTSGSAAGLQKCINAIGKEGKVIELSWYGTKEVLLRLGEDFHFLRKQITSSQVGHIPATKSARWNYKRRKEVVWELLKNKVFEKHISTEVFFEDSPSFYDKLRANKQSTEGLGWVIKY